MQTGIADDAVLLNGGAGRTRRSPTGRRWASTRSASRSRGRASRRTRARRRRRPASSRRPERPAATTGAPSTPRWTASSARGSSRCSCSTARRRCGPRATRSAATRATGRARRRSRTSPRRSPRRYGADVDQYILWNEPNLPVWMQPQADCGKQRCTPVSPNVYRAMVRAAYPAIHAVDPVAHRPHRRARPGRRRPQERATRTCARCEFLRGARLRRRATCTPSAPAPAAAFQPAIADGIAYHPHCTRHAPSQPYAHPRQRRPRQPEEDRAPARPPAARAAACRARRRRSASGSTSTATRPTRPTSCAASRPAPRTATSSRPRYLAWRDPRVMLLAQYLWKDEPARRAASTPAGSRACTTPTASPKPALAHFDDPIWVDFRANVAVGPGAPGRRAHRRRSSAALAGRRDALGDARDGADRRRRQLADRRRRRSPFATYRAIARRRHDERRDDRRRRRGQAAERGRRRRPATDAAVVARARSAHVAGAPIPRSFAGFSMEYWSAPSYLGGTRPNPIFAQLVQTLAARGNGAPTIRIGGNSTDETWWNPVGAPRPAGVATDVTPAWLGRPRRSGRQLTRTPIMLGAQPRAARPAPTRPPTPQAAAGRCRPDRCRARDRQRARPLHPAARRSAVGSAAHRARPAAPRRATATATTAASCRRSAARSRRPRRASRSPAGGFASSAWEDNEDDLLSEPGPGPMGFSAHTYALHTCDRQPARPQEGLLREGRCSARARSPRRWRAWRSSPRSPRPTARRSASRRSTRPTAAACTARATRSPRRCGAPTCCSRSPTPACAA